VQMVLPLAEMVGWLREGLGELIRQAGLQLMELLMEEEVREVVGERSRRQPDRTANRWGKERGFCVVMGQKVPIERPRVRTTDDQEIRVGSSCLSGCFSKPQQIVFAARARLPGSKFGVHQRPRCLAFAPLWASFRPHRALGSIEVPGTYWHDGRAGATRYR
jgi:hypothetical protein